ncbi:MAG: tol-pal system protein YbgF [Rhodobacteraceae bacterium]|nr:tol-pal system protein YbgF [Paracoccaceae bacterium]
MRKFLPGLLCAAIPVVALAQDAETLADIRQELQFVYGEVFSLKRELSTTGNIGLQGNDKTAPALQRIDALEAEIQRLTGLIEQKEFTIQSVVKDGTNRIGDLEFRLCQLEPGCDVTGLDRTMPIGGQVATGPAPDTASATGSAETATTGATDSERASFEQAMATLEARDFVSAATQFESLIKNFPGGLLTGEAHYWRGVALAGDGNWQEAARAFLESYSGSPEGVKAPEALYRLGLSLRELGQTQEACLMFSEVPVRYPAAAIVPAANSRFSALGCG